MIKRYAITDIHGCVKTFKALLSQIGLSKEDELYLLGDYIDRGPGSKAVIDYIWELQVVGYQVHCIRGNHEQMLLDTLADGSQLSTWLLHGGWKTISSFGVRWLEDIPPKYIRWISRLPYYLEVEKFIFVHAGLNFNSSFPLNSKRAMLWSRDWYTYINYRWLGDRIIVHGHTPVVDSTIKRDFKNLTKNKYLNIDNGCFLDKAGYGNLVAFDLTTRKLHFQPFKD